MNLTESYVPTSLLARRALAWSRYIPHKPLPQQKAFLGLDCLEALYGGAAGGGKSDALLMDALQDVCTPGYSAILFRRTYQDLSLPGALLDRAHSWLHNTDAHWDGIKKQWRFPSGAKLAFGYLDTDKDRYRYQSAEFQSVGFDELTQFPEGNYRYLLSRLRRLASMNVPIRSRAGSNPGGIGHEWVKHHFVDDAAQDGVKFVSAKLDDNPHLDRDEYRKSLSRLDSITRRQLENGEWIQDASGLMYPGFSQTRNAIKHWPSGPFTSLIGLDFGVVDMNAITVLCWRDNDPITYVRQSYQLTGLADDVARDVRDLMARLSPAKIVGDTGGLGKAFAEEMRVRHGIPVEAAQKADKLGFVKLLNGAFERALVKIYEPECKELIKQLITLPKDKTTGAEIPGFDNHAADSCLYAWRESLSFGEREKEEVPAMGTKAYWDKIESAMKAEGDRWVEKQNQVADEWDTSFDG